MYFTADGGNETQVVPAIGTTPPPTPHYPFVGPQRPIGGSGLLWWWMTLALYGPARRQCPKDAKKDCSGWVGLVIENKALAARVVQSGAQQTSAG